MDDEKDVSSTLLLFDTFLQLKGLQKLLVTKGIVTEEELQGATDDETKAFLRPFLEKVGITDIDETLATLIKNRKL